MSELLRKCDGDCELRVPAIMALLFAGVLIGAVAMKFDKPVANPNLKLQQQLEKCASLLPNNIYTGYPVLGTNGELIGCVFAPKDGQENMPVFPHLKRNLIFKHIKPTSLM